MTALFLTVFVEQWITEKEHLPALIGAGATAVSLLMPVRLAVLLGADATIEKRVKPEYRCDCSRSRVEKALISIGREELEQMIRDGEPVTLHCDFCNTDYTYTVDELKQLVMRV